MASGTRADLETRHEGKVKDQRKTEAKRREAYRLVDIRDGGRCRACQVFTTSFAPNRIKTREHHHLRGRRVRNAETTGNICLLCGCCHDQVKSKRRLIITGNADSTLEFSQDGRVWHG